MFELSAQVTAPIVLFFEKPDEQKNLKDEDVKKFLEIRGRLVVDIPEDSVKPKTQMYHFIFWEYNPRSYSMTPKMMSFNDDGNSVGWKISPKDRASILEIINKEKKGAAAK
jgi:hypothetical protein